LLFSTFQLVLNLLRESPLDQSTQIGEERPAQDRNWARRAEKTRISNHTGAFIMKNDAIERTFRSGKRIRAIWNDCRK